MLYVLGTRNLNDMALTQGATYFSSSPKVGDIKFGIYPGNPAFTAPTLTAHSPH